MEAFSLGRREIYEFGRFRLDVDERTIERLDGQAVDSLPEKTFQILALLVRRRGHLVTKDEILDQIWPDTIVEEGNVDRRIHNIRQFLGKADGNGKFIETVRGRGYRFIARVDVVEVSQSWLPEILRIPDDDERPAITNGHHTETNGSEEKAGPIEDQESPIAASAPARWFSKKLAIACGLAVAVLAATTSSIWMTNKPKFNTPILNTRFSAELLSTNGNVFAPVISPNGKSVAYISRHSNGQQSVWMRDLDNGSNVEIIPASWDTYRSFAFSPDSNQVYFVRSSISDQEGDIYRTAIFGGIPQKIVSASSGHFSISPDGASISFVRCSETADESCSLRMVNAADGENERILVTRKAPYRIADNRFSPDGNSIAFAAGQSRNMANDFGLFSVRVDDGTEKRLTNEMFFNIRGLIWLADGGDILIAASRIPNPTYRIWQVSAADGKVVALTSDTEDYYDLSLDDSGERLVAAGVSDDFAITIMSRATGRVIGTIDDATSPSFGQNGKIYFRSSSGNGDIWCANYDGSQLRQLTSDVYSDGAPIAGRNHIYFTSNRSGEMHIWSMALDGTEVRQLTTRDGGYPIAISSDDKSLYYLHALDRSLWRMAKDTGDQEKVLDERSDVIAVSPSGRYIAFGEPLNGKKTIFVTELDALSNWSTREFDLHVQDCRPLDVAWQPDEEALLIALEGKDCGGRLLRLRMVDGRVDDVLLPNNKPIDSPHNFALSPDGQVLAAAQGRWLHDAVLIRGLK